MDKITRVLLLYSKLIRGEPVNKQTFCFETEISGRSFDRDIEDVRLYFSDMYQANEVIYDKVRNNYYISGRKRLELEIEEYQLIENVLLDSGILRKDELFGLLARLASNTKNDYSYIKRIQEKIKEYAENDGVTTLKMHGDLCNVIENQYVIQIAYFDSEKKNIEQIAVIPCGIEYEDGKAYLLAFNKDANLQIVSYFQMDRINSFRILQRENGEERALVRSVFGKERNNNEKRNHPIEEILIICQNESFRNLQNKFKDIEVIKDQSEEMFVRIRSSREEFVDWLLIQPVGCYIVKEPKVINFLINEKIKKLSEFYS